jgi:hypothetical protein
MKRFGIMALALVFLTGTVATTAFGQDAPKKEKKKKVNKKKDGDDKDKKLSVFFRAGRHVPPVVSVHVSLYFLPFLSPVCPLPNSLQGNDAGPPVSSTESPVGGWPMLAKHCGKSGLVECFRRKIRGGEQIVPFQNVFIGAQNEANIFSIARPGRRKLEENQVFEARDANCNTPDLAQGRPLDHGSFKRKCREDKI